MELIITRSFTIAIPPSRYASYIIFESTSLLFTPLPILLLVESPSCHCPISLISRVQSCRSQQQPFHSLLRWLFDMHLFSIPWICPLSQSEFSSPSITHFLSLSLSLFSHVVNNTQLGRCFSPGCFTQKHTHTRTQTQANKHTLGTQKHTCTHACKTTHTRAQVRTIPCTQHLLAGTHTHTHSWCSNLHICRIERRADSTK